MELKAGESLGVIGRNGAGKSTLLQLLAGILAPDQGRLINHGVRVSLLALQLGFLPHLSGRDNVFLSGMLLGLRRREIARRFDWIVEFSELGGRIDDPVHTYSAGMSARLGFSIAFQASPDVLLIDEVLGVGDAPFRHKSATALRERILARDHSVVLVSHDAQTIRQLCDRAVWLVKGETRAIGPVDEVLERYEAENH
ncbi:MAG TPA: ABC transporter ATP-binding protein [Methylothermaceae bacterium]|nr:ABC transporter ATP-binding protein [Methylothermaceae bacterium]